jgi:hypothetical protein
MSITRDGRAAARARIARAAAVSDKIALARIALCVVSLQSD